MKKQLIDPKQLKPLSKWQIFRGIIFIIFIISASLAISYLVIPHMLAYTLMSSRGSAVAADDLRSATRLIEKLPDLTRKLNISDEEILAEITALNRKKILHSFEQISRQKTISTEKSAELFFRLNGLTALNRPEILTLISVKLNRNDIEQIITTTRKKGGAFSYYLEAGKIIAEKSYHRIPK